MLDAKGVMDSLRQKQPFLYVDRVLELVPGERCVALKNVTMGEPCFQGHFPDEPIMPGVLIVEAMAQSGGFMFARSGGELRGYIVAIDKMKFLQPVVPGDSLVIECSRVVGIGGIERASCVAKVAGKVVARGEITYKLERVDA